MCHAIPSLTGMTSKADLQAGLGELQLEVGTQRTHRCGHRPTSQEVTPLTGTSSGILTWGFQQAAEWSAGAVLSRAPWTIKVVAQGRGLHREGKERMLTLAEGAGAALQSM